MADYTDVRLEHWVRGPLFVADTDTARANQAVLERHLSVEWQSDIEATMATIHPDDPWQRIPGLGVEVVGLEGVREYYLNRFASWPGPGMKHFDRVAIVDHAAYIEGTLDFQPSGDFGGIEAAGVTIQTPTVIVVDFRDGLILGETLHLDSAKALGQVAAR
jgi:predicted ester cyclase